MKRLIITTTILLIAVMVITFMYFSNLNPPAQQAGKVMHNIPADAALIFELKNDTTIYNIFKNNTLFSTFIGEQKTNHLNALRHRLLQNPLLQSAFEGKSIFISLHPQADSTNMEFLITMPGNDHVANDIEKVERQKNSGLIIHSRPFNGKPGFNIYMSDIKRRFFVVLNKDNSLSGSFSQHLVEQASAYQPAKQAPAFVQVADRQNSNSIAKLYVNYLQLAPLMEQLFKNKNTDFFRSFKQLPAMGALSLNYKTDAIMFNGISHIDHDEKPGYLNLFADQQPAKNSLKSIFPATTAYSMNFAVSNPVKFEQNLFNWQTSTGVNAEKKMLFNRIKKETGVDLATEFMNRLGNEFAIITTRYQEKLAIIKVKNGLDIRPFMVNISTMGTADEGQFNYDKLPYYLLGDAFSIFRRPYFIIADNYLLICASRTGLMEYYKNYTNGNFLNKSDDYVRFDNLQAESSNISFFITFKNAGELLKAELKPAFAKLFEAKNKDWNNFYGAAYQLTSSDRDFYTNFYMRLNVPDTASVNP